MGSWRLRLARQHHLYLSLLIQRWGLLWLYLYRVAVGRIPLLPPSVGATWERFVSAIALWARVSNSAAAASSIAGVEAATACAALSKLTRISAAAV